MGSDVKQLTCIICPISCRVSVLQTDSGFEFSGNRCGRGVEFAELELTAPRRQLTTTVRTVFPDMPVLPVRTSGEVPKRIIPGIIKALAEITVTERIGIGGTVAPDILGSGCDIIATSNDLKV